MSRLSELAAYLADDKRQAEDLGTYLLASRELAHDLRRAFAQFGAERKAAQTGDIAGLLGAAQNSRWLTVGLLDDALMIIRGAMTGIYAAADSFTVRKRPDGGLTLLGRYEGEDVSLRISSGYRPAVARLRARLGMPVPPPEPLDTTGDDGLNRREQLSRKLVRSGSDLHAQVKDTANTSLAAGRFEKPGPDTPHITGESVAALAILSVIALDGFARWTRNWHRRAK